ncbi:RAS guanyl-releasing protein 2-A-like isoform X2 [Rhopilema esculentum]|uniref:RAS guanyl-releasing protein 2-A-like isoform X2 n=1 Tax=Rhopilema esculentum TaxID=499914 RepID=UPI0031D41823
MGATDDTEINDVDFEKSPEAGFIIRAATFPYLMRRTLHDFDALGPVVEPCKFSSVFFLTYQWFLEPGELLSLFSDRYKMLYLSDKEKERAKKLQICQTVSYWINNFGYDFKSSQDVRMQLLEFQNEVQLDIGNKAARLLDLEKWNVTKRSQKFKLDSRTHDSLNFNDISSKDFAANITYLDWNGISKIQFVEWRNYTKEGKADSAPNLQKQIAMFNNISKWVVAMVLQKESASGRARQFKKFIQICRELKDLGNYNSLMAVIGGLSNSILNRMHKTREFLSNEDKLFIKEMLELLSSDNNYSNYRNEVSKLDGIYLPILGVLMKDLISLDTAVNDFFEKRKRPFCNYKKMLQLAQLLHQVTNLAKHKPEIVPKQDLVTMLRVSLQPRYSEEELYELSLAREPRCETIGYRTLKSNGLKPVFAEWAAGVNATPDRETVERYVDRMVDAVFKIYDKDRDGSINQAEFQSIATNFPFIDDFQMLDTNCDDSISREEMRNYFMNVNSHKMTRDFVHCFQETTIITPVLCEYCTGYLWGLGKSAYKCRECQITCHKDCKDHVVMECRQKNHIKVKMPKSKALKKKLKFMEQSFGGSTDSQISNGESSSPISLQKINLIDNDELQLLKSKLYDSEKVCWLNDFFPFEI